MNIEDIVVVKLREAVGKKIVAVSADSRDVMFRFDDDSVAGVSNGEYGLDEIKPGRVHNGWEYGHELIALGIVTKQDIDDARIRRERRMKRVQEEARRKQYESLKREFEGEA